MKLYQIFIKEKYKEKLNKFYSNNYICRDNFYAYTNNKQILNEFKKQRNLKAFSIVKHNIDDSEFKLFESMYSNMRLGYYDIKYIVKDTLVMILTAYEVDYINERYTEDILMECPYKISDFNYKILKSGYRKVLDMIMMTYFIESCNPDDDKREKYMEDFECGYLPCGYTGITNYYPNELGILCNAFQVLFDKKER